MKQRHAICIVVDGLRASALGTYGNTTYPTPQLDALAARSTVVDWLFADSPRLETFYRGGWHGEHALRPETSREKSVIEVFNLAGVQQWLVTDEPWLIEQSTEQPWDDTLLFETGAAVPAESVGDTALGNFFSNAVERLAEWKTDVDEQDASSLTWIHTRGLHGPWDAPPAMRAELLAEQDPPLPEFVEPPKQLRDVDDPDVLLGHRVAYAAQIAVLDACVGAFVEAMNACFSGSETLMSLIASRGFALGEHGAIGTGCRDMFGEQLHLPWLLHVCGNEHPISRHCDLAKPADLPATLLDWLDVNASGFPRDGISVLPSLDGDRPAARKLAVSGHEAEQTIRTPDWMLRRTPAGDELYSKPDDRWEFNDVADRCPEIVEELSEELARFERCCQSGEPLPLCAADEDLTLPTRKE